MKTILVGGFETGSFDQISEIFAALKGDYTLRKVTHLGDLQKLLDPLQGDLLILNMNTPIRALEWLAAIARMRASIPILGVGGNQNADFQEYSKRFPDQYFPQMDYIREPLTEETLLESVRVGICDTAWGVIGGLSLSTLLQMIHMENKTCTIRVISGRRQGFLYLRAGEVINARYRRCEGLEAAYLLLASESPRAEISGQLHDSTQLINASLEELLMDAARLQDEVTTTDTAEEQEDEVEGPLPISEQGKWKSTTQEDSPKPSSKVGLLSIIGAGIILLLVLGAFVIRRKEQIEVLTTPSGAIVSLDGQKCGETPLSIALPKLQGTLKMEVPGFLPLSYALHPGDRKLSFTLEPMPKPVEATPASTAIEEKPNPKDEKSVPQPKKSKTKTAPKPAPKTKGDVFDQIRKQ
jgi:hypothetical protein